MNKLTLKLNDKYIGYLKDALHRDSHEARFAASRGVQWGNRHFRQSSYEILEFAGFRVSDFIEPTLTDNYLVFVCNETPVLEVNLCQLR